MNFLYIYSLFCVFLTWILLIIGGLVNPMGASMACPDWYFFPTCNGEFMPPMTGGVLYEHGHRLVASMVGIATLFLTVLCMKSPKVDILTKKFTLISLFLVILQGTFGGITVLLNLSVIVSSVHLLCAMVFFALLVTVSFRLSPLKRPSALFEKDQFPMFIAICLTFAQLLWGGVVRHMGAGMACGDDLLACGTEIWPSWFLGQLHMGHRLLGYALFFIVGYASIKARKSFVERGAKLEARLALLPILITFCQLGLGLLAIYSIRNPSVLALHTGFGGLLLASLLTNYLLALPARNNIKSYC